MATDRYPEIGGKPAKAQLTVVQGDDWSRTLTLRTGSATGPVVDLTGCTLTASVHKQLTDNVQLFDVPVNVASPLSGLAVITLSKQLIASLSASCYDGDETGQHWLILRMVDSASQRRTLLQVRMQVLASGDPE